MSGAAETRPTGTARRAPSLGALRRRRRRRRRPTPAPGERCEMCAEPIADASTPHVVERRGAHPALHVPRLLPAVHPPGRGAGPLPRRARSLRCASRRSGSTEPQWDALQIPVRMAFFFHNSDARPRRRLLPEPGGRHRVAAPARGLAGAGRRRTRCWPSLAPDVEALLVRGRARRSGFECFLVPIDACYELTGVVRRRWRGFDGGEEAWRDIDAFFAAAARAQPRGAGS